MARRKDVHAAREFLSANERFKRTAADIVAASVLISVGLHYVLFETFPTLAVADFGPLAEEVTLVRLPPEVKIPPPPGQIARPARPRVAPAAVLKEDITIAPTTFEHNPVESLPPPPSREVDVRERPVYIARDVEPRLTNGSEVGRLLKQMYPKVLRDAGIGGTVVLWVFVETDGMPGACQVHESSGYTAFDETAERIVTYMVFSPAMSRDRPVAVWIAQPIEFRIRDG